MMQRALSALPLLVLAAALGLVSGLHLTAALLALLAAALSLLGPRAAPGRLGEGLLLAASLTVGALLAALPRGGLAEAPEGALHPLWSAIAAAALCAAATRRLLRAPLGGEQGGFALGLLALLACGATRSGARYSVPVCLFLVASLLQLRALDPRRPRLGELGRRGRLLLVALPPLAAALTVLALLPLRPLSDWIQARFYLAYESGAARAGFSERFQLGALSRLLSSDEVVLRLRGARGAAAHLGEHLRGHVYDHYEGGRWTTLGGARPARVAVSKGRPDPAAEDALELLPEGDGDRLFLPLPLSALYTDSGYAVSVAHGALRRVPADGGRPLWLRPGPRRVLPLPPPGAEDLLLPPALRAPLGRLAAEWTAGAGSDRERLLALERRLRQGYRYSLRFQRAAGQDPVLDFLLRHREGHCEYFASALALLGRAAGVPARVVGGYRLTERNPLSGDYVVRERDAHAWVEAYLPEDGWGTYDATPAALPGDEERAMGLPRAALDVASARLGAALGWVAARPARELAPAALLLAALLSLYLLRGRLRRRARSGAAQAPPFSPPSPAFLRLAAALARAGEARDPAEPLERYAARLRDRASAPLIERYAALRYGGEGDAAQLEGAMARRAEELEGASAARP